MAKNSSQHRPEAGLDKRTNEITDIGDVSPADVDVISSDETSPLNSKKALWAWLILCFSVSNLRVLQEMSYGLMI
jgi:hypothetical protein